MSSKRQMREASATLRGSEPGHENDSYSGSSSKNASGMAMAQEMRNKGRAEIFDYYEHQRLLVSERNVVRIRHMESRVPWMLLVSAHSALQPGKGAEGRCASVKRNFADKGVLH